ncbi:hypothetical protein ACEZDB_36035 [Streptacidiphilus sp. N1-3]|uniref:Uncharacterized protein n=1 Tax=Streptacidiphilus alkalitolerans TaxID=3342712 RepID=A0ABV6XCU6_9ACTN
MSSQHRDPSMSVRVPADLQAATRQALGGRDLRAFVLACCTALAADPQAFLAGLEEHWPPPSRIGRPPKVFPPAAQTGEPR